MAGDKGILFEFDVSGDKEVSRGLSRFARYSEDLRDPFGQIADNFYRIERGQFASEGAQGGGKWKQLNPNYAARKAAIFGPQPILVATGRLRESLTGKSIGHIRKIDKQSFVIGTSVPYAAYHQQPSAMPAGRKLPRRPVIQLRNQDKKNWTKIIQSYLVYRRNQLFGGY